MDRLKREPFFVSDWRVEPLLHRVSRYDHTKQVEPKLIDVLVYLAAHAGEVVTREQILTDVWPGTIVTDHALTRSISELRKILDDDSKQPSIIETIPKTGYRLVAPVSFTTASSDGQMGATGAISVQLPDLRLPATTIPLPLRMLAVAGGVITVSLLIFAATIILGDPPAASLYASTPLTSLPGREVMPTFSPDGERIAFSWTQKFYEPVRDIYVKHLSSDNSVPVTAGKGQNVYPTWSPDGNRLAFLRYTEESCAIFTVSALGTSERKVDDCGYRIKDLSWSPDGTQLAFAGRASPAEPQRIFLLNLDDLSRTELTRPPAHIHGDDLPVFSPDGRTLAFRRSRIYGVNDMYTVQLGRDTAEPVRRTYDQRMIAGYDWMADGRAIVFSSNRSGLFRLWRMPLSDNSPQPETGINAWDPGLPTIARNGNRLAFVEWFYEINIWEFPLEQDGSEPSAIIASTRGDYQPSYSPDGRRIAFSSNRSGSNEIWVADRNGDNPLRLTDLGQAATRSASWSPDSRYLAFESIVDGYSRVFVVDAEGGTPRPLVADTSDAIVPTWSADGESLYFGSNRSGEWNIWNVDADGGEPRQVTDSSAYAGRESPDGRLLYFTRYDFDGIWSLDLESGEERRIVDAFPSSTWTAWTVRPDGLYFLRRGEENSRLFRKGFSFEEPTLVAEFDCTYMEHSSGLSISPDGAHLLIACIDRAESDVMLVENYP